MYKFDDSLPVKLLKDHQALVINHRVAMRFVLFIGLFLSSFISHASITIKGTVTDVNGFPVSNCDVFF